MEYSKLIKSKFFSLFFFFLSLYLSEVQKTKACFILLSGGFFCHSVVGNSRGKGYGWNGNGE